MHTARITRTGDHLSVSIDDRPLGEVQVDAAKARFGLQLAVRVRRRRKLPTSPCTSPQGEPIFNGHDLTGWWSPHGLKSWQGKDGMIECLHKDGNYLPLHRTRVVRQLHAVPFEYFALARIAITGIGIRTAARWLAVGRWVRTCNSTTRPAWSTTRRCPFIAMSSPWRVPINRKNGTAS